MSKLSMRKCLSVVFLLFMLKAISAQERLMLYPNGIPNVREDVNLDKNKPEFYFYKPSGQSSDKVFLILPGGGYGIVADNHEGHDVARRLCDLGYASFVLRYRLPVASQMIDKKIAPIQDAQSALLYIRMHAGRLGINGAKIAVIGFSAGGHLASTMSTHFDISYLGEVDKKLLRPDYSVLVYPVITMQEGITHQGSKMNLIGPDCKEDDVAHFSNERQVTPDTPPAYIIHADDDKVVPIKNAFLYKESLEKYNIKNGFYRYSKGGHGFGMYNKLEEGDWLIEMLKWINNI